MQIKRRELPVLVSWSKPNNQLGIYLTRKEYVQKAQGGVMNIIKNLFAFERRSHKTAMKRVASSFQIGNLLP